MPDVFAGFLTEAAVQTAAKTSWAAVPRGHNVLLGCNSVLAHRCHCQNSMAP